MALIAEQMATLMIDRAVSQGLSDQPPEFALSRMMLLIAKGVTATFQEELSAFGIVNYGPGKPAIPVGVITPQLGLDGLDPDRYSTALQTASGFTGLFSAPFFFGVAGIVDYVQTNVTVFGASPTATGTGDILAAGVVFDPDACFDNMKQEALDEEIMTVRLGVHVADPLDTIEDPTTFVPLSLGDLFIQAEILLRSVSNQLTLELLNATKSGLPVTGIFDPQSPDLTFVAPLGRFA